MNIYSKKNIWNKLLILFAFLIIATSFIYNNWLIKEITANERKQIAIWAEAIKQKSELVKNLNNLFSSIKQDEKKRIQLWAEAVKGVNSTLNDEVRAVYFNIISNNTSIPVVVVNQQQQIIANLNTENILQPNEHFSSKLKSKFLPDTIVIDDGFGNSYTVYYQDSKIFTELNLVLNKVINTFIDEIVINAPSVPVIICDSLGNNILKHNNLDTTKIKDTNYFQRFINQAQQQNSPIKLEIGGEPVFVYYKTSELITQLKYYPIFQWATIILFVIIAYYLFLVAKRAEENQLWVGMSKETAHQIGTPLSSLMAWTEILASQPIDTGIIDEIKKDINRLELVSERFSKIGSQPTLQKQAFLPILTEIVDYIQQRCSSKIEFIKTYNVPPTTQVNINKPLFQWVIENLLKNAIDAIHNRGCIHVMAQITDSQIFIDILDTGKGIPKSKFKTIFKPGFTTKSRGWGLGLSLSKRIIEEYHNGKIFVKKSEIGQGTIFRIILNLTQDV